MCSGNGRADYNSRSIAETAMYKVKQLFGGGAMTLRDNDDLITEA